MLSKVIDWFRRERSHTRAHQAAWAGQITPGLYGWSPFQRSCDLAVSALLVELGLAYAERREHSGKEFYIEGRIARPELEVWIYADGANLVGTALDLRLEHWDAESPASLTQQLCERIRAAAAAADASAV